MELIQPKKLRNQYIQQLISIEIPKLGSIIYILEDRIQINIKTLIEIVKEVTDLKMFIYTHQINSEQAVFHMIITEMKDNMKCKKNYHKRNNKFKKRRKKVKTYLFLILEQ